MSGLRKPRPPKILAIRVSPSGWLRIPDHLIKTAKIRGRTCVLAATGTRVELYGPAMYKRARRRMDRRFRTVAAALKGLL